LSEFGFDDVGEVIADFGHLFVYLLSFVNFNFFLLVFSCLLIILMTCTYISLPLLERSLYDLYRSNMYSRRSYVSCDCQSKRSCYPVSSPLSDRPSPRKRCCLQNRCKTVDITHYFLIAITLYQETLSDTYCTTLTSQGCCSASFLRLKSTRTAS
jgi:hypothetical protein